MTSPRITELSGLVASRLQPGLFLAHNDSGDLPTLFTLGLDGALVAEHEVEGATAFDWEDIAAGPCEAGSCVFIGDIGDNEKKRAEIVVYRVDEAALVGGTGKVKAEALRAVYPDGPHDAEALLADPASGDLLVFTKQQSGPTQVFRWPGNAAAGSLTTLEQVASIQLPFGVSLVTAGDAHPCAPRFLLRTYLNVFEFRAPPGGSLLDALKATPVTLPAAFELQGEAVAYLHQGDGFVTIAEGATPAVHVTRCP